MSDPSPTAERLIDAAQALVQTRGYNGFSYADLSTAVGIRKASVHHHFAVKGDLGRAVAARYRRTFAHALAEIEAATDQPRRRLDRYVELYASALSERGRMCLCGMLAAEFDTLPAPVQEEVRGFFADQRAWLRRVLAAGDRGGARAPSLADALLAGLEGALLVSRSDADAARFRATARVLLDALV